MNLSEVAKKQAQQSPNKQQLFAKTNTLSGGNWRKRGKLIVIVKLGGNFSEIIPAIRKQHKQLFIGLYRLMARIAYLLSHQTEEEI